MKRLSAIFALILTLSNIIAQTTSKSTMTTLDFESRV